MKSATERTMRCMVRLAAIACVLSTQLLLAETDSISVLFIGNSHTYTNDLPQMFRNLSLSGGRGALTEMSAPGGYSLMEHVSTETTLALIARGGWDHVILQEQSQIPTIEYWRYNGMYPAARVLDSLITERGCRTAFFMTWGWKYGGQHTYQGYSSPVFADYFEMQETVRVAYERISDELSALLCPVGMAWARAKHLDSLVDLWQSDYSHATVKGTYLAACVFYAALWRADPTGLSYTAGLTPEEARFFQEVAWRTIAVAEPKRDFLHPGSGAVAVHPNPCHRALTVDFSIPKPGAVRVTLRDVQGRLVRSIAGGYRRPGAHSVSCCPSDGAGRAVPNGVYLVGVEAADLRAFASVTLLK